MYHLCVMNTNPRRLLCVGLCLAAAVCPPAPADDWRGAAARLEDLCARAGAIEETYGAAGDILPVLLGGGPEALVQLTGQVCAREKDWKYRSFLLANVLAAQTDPATRQTIARLMAGIAGDAGDRREVRLLAIKTLRRLAAAESAGTLEKLIQDHAQRPDLRAEALAALAVVSPGDAAPLLLQAADDDTEDPSVRIAGLAALERLRVPAARPLVCRKLAQESPVCARGRSDDSLYSLVISIHLARALPRLAAGHPDQAADILSRLAADKTRPDYLRTAAAESLGELPESGTASKRRTSAAGTEPRTPVKAGEPAPTNTNFPTNGDFVFRDMIQAGVPLHLGHGGIFLQLGPNDDQRYVIEASGAPYRVGILKWDSGEPNFLGEEEYWGAYTLKDMTKERRQAIVYEALKHVGVEEFPWTWAENLSNRYKNPKGNSFCYDQYRTDYPDGSFRCDGFLEYCVETAYGENWIPGQNQGILPNDTWSVSPADVMNYANSSAADGDSPHGGRDSAPETTPPSVIFQPDPVYGHRLSFTLSGADDCTADSDLFFRVRLIPLNPNPHANTGLDWTAWAGQRAWSFLLNEGTWTCEVMARDRTGNESAPVSAGICLTGSSGDLDGDLECSVVDTLLALRMAVGLTVTVAGRVYAPPAYSAELLWRADLSADGLVDVIDVMLILSQALCLW